MTEPTRPDPVPAPPRAEGRIENDERPEERPGETPAVPFADLDERPVSEHVAVYEAEHARLQRELGTIDQL